MSRHESTSLSATSTSVKSLLPNANHMQETIICLLPFKIMIYNAAGISCGEDSSSRSPFETGSFQPHPDSKRKGWKGHSPKLLVLRPYILHRSVVIHIICIYVHETAAGIFRTLVPWHKTKSMYVQDYLYIGKHERTKQLACLLLLFVRY